MKKAPIPYNEQQRLKDLYSFNILDSQQEEDYEDLVHLVSDICHCPMATITFIDKDRQWFKATKNIDAREGDRGDSFCGHAILEKEILLVEDASKDERFFDNPDVTGGLKVAFYAGAPIFSPNGYALGSVCAIDNVPRKLTDQQIVALQRVARQISRLLELRLKNRQILEVTQLLLQAEKQIAQFNIQNAEKNQFNTAYQLHEEIAQTSAAVKLYINHVKNVEQVSSEFLDYGIFELNNLINSVKRLSKDLIPTTFLNDNYAAHIGKLLDECDVQETTPIEYQLDRELQLKGEYGLMIFRIIQDALCLAKVLHPESIIVNMHAGEANHISIDYVNPKEKKSHEIRLHEANIANRANILNGTVEANFYEEDGGGFKVTVQLPLHAPHEEHRD